MLDFIKLCKEFNIAYIESGHHHAHEGWVQVNCPFCTDGSHGWHLGFSLEKGNMNCWRCGSHPVYEFLSIALSNRKISIKQIMKQYDQAGFLPSNKKIIIRKRKAKLPPQVEPMVGIHRRYLLGRKFKPAELQDEWHLRGTKGFSKEWNWRIIAPIKNISGIITAYAGRALGEGVKPKWKFSDNKDMTENPKKMLYGIDKVKDRVLIVEGISDVWRMGIGSVGVFGIDWTIEQASILKNYTHRFIMFDPETQAQKQAKKLADWLAPFSGKTEIITGFKTDPGDFQQAEADNIMKELGF